MSNPLPWAEVKRRALDQLEQIKDDLVSAPADQVLSLQIRAQVIQQFIAWFEAGAPSERRIGEEISGY